MLLKWGRFQISTRISGKCSSSGQKHSAETSFRMSRRIFKEGVGGLFVHVLCVACIDHLNRVALDDVGVVPLVGGALGVQVLILLHRRR